MLTTEQRPQFQLGYCNYFLQIPHKQKVKDHPNPDTLGVMAALILTYRTACFSFLCATVFKAIKFIFIFHLLFGKPLNDSHKILFIFIIMEGNKHSKSKKKRSKRTVNFR